MLLALHEGRPLGRANGVVGRQWSIGNPCSDSVLQIAPPSRPVRVLLRLRGDELHQRGRAGRVGQARTSARATPPASPTSTAQLATTWLRVVPPVRTVPRHLDRV